MPLSYAIASINLFALKKTWVHFMQRHLSYASTYNKFFFCGAMSLVHLKQFQHFEVM
jgi:hypothetical protein